MEAASPPPVDDGGDDGARRRGAALTPRRRLTRIPPFSFGIVFVPCSTGFVYCLVSKRYMDQIYGE